MFDLDGTLFETSHGIHKAVNELMRRQGKSDLPYDLVTALIGEGLHNLLKRLPPVYHEMLESIRDLEKEFHDIYREIFLSESHLFPGLLDFLKSRTEKLAVVSNKNEYYVKKMLEHTDLNQFEWQMEVGGDTYENKKPHPQPIQEVLKFTDTSPHEAVLIGDGIPDIDAANAAGVHMIAVTFGYGPYEELLRRGAVTSIDHYNELSTALTQIPATAASQI